MKGRLYLKLLETKKAVRMYQLRIGVWPRSHSSFPWSTFESEFQNGIWLPSACSSSPADLRRGGGRSADSTLMGRPTKAALRLRSLDPVVTGLAGRRHNELQTGESAALSPWNLVVGSGGEGGIEPGLTQLFCGRPGHVTHYQWGSEFQELSPRLCPECSPLSWMEVRSQEYSCTFVWNMNCVVWLFIILGKLLTVASEHAPQFCVCTVLGEVYLEDVNSAGSMVIQKNMLF